MFEPAGAAGAAGAGGAGGAAITTVVEPFVPVLTVVPAAGATAVGMLMVAGNAAPPLAVVASEVMAAKDEALAKVGSGFELLTKVVNALEIEVKEAAATFWLMTELSWAFAEVIKAALEGNAPLLAAASVAKPDTVANKEPLLDNSSEVNNADNKAALESVVVIFEVELVSGAGAVNKLVPGGRPKDTATVALATAPAA